MIICLYTAPYGIREGPRKLGSKSEEVKPISEDQLSSCVANFSSEFGDFIRDRNLASHAMANACHITF